QTERYAGRLRGPVQLHQCLPSLTRKTQLRYSGDTLVSAPGATLLPVTWRRTLAPVVVFVTWLVRRIAIAALTVWLGSVLVFAAIQLNPTNPAIVALGAQSTHQARVIF